MVLWKNAFLCSLSVIFFVSAANADPPLVENVVASQRLDGSGLVDIYFDLQSNEVPPLTVAVDATIGPDPAWGIPVTATAGDVGSGVLPGPARHIVWNTLVDVPDAYGIEYRVRICAVGPIGLLPTVFVPAGTFPMGDETPDDGAGSGDELPVHSVAVGPYFINRFVITNQQFVDGLNWAYAAGGLININGGIVKDVTGTVTYCRTTTSSSTSRLTWNGAFFGVLDGFEYHPVEEVSWFGAAAYSNWRSLMENLVPAFNTSTWTCDFDADGYRLPTEAEWEKAAAWDPSQQRHFRYGEHTDGSSEGGLDGHRANYWMSGDTFDNAPGATTTPVGYFDGTIHEGFQTQLATSAFGCFDMSGNAWEWCYDWYAANYYGASAAVDPTGPATGQSRVLRGGSWGNFVSALRCSNRTSAGPTNMAHHGFRLVRRGVPSTAAGAACGISNAFPIMNATCTLSDVDGSGIADTTDVELFVSMLLLDSEITPSQQCAADINRDGLIDGDDVAAFVACVVTGPC